MFQNLLEDVNHTEEKHARRRHKGVFAPTSEWAHDIDRRQQRADVRNILRHLISFPSAHLLLLEDFVRLVHKYELFHTQFHT